MDNLETLVKDIVTDVIEKMDNVVPELCNGCIIDHPSQKQHDLCLMASERERLDTTFEPAWRLLEWTSIKNVLVKLCINGYQTAWLHQNSKYSLTFFIFLSSSSSSSSLHHH